MAGFLLRILINAVILFAVVAKLPGIFVDTLGGTLLGTRWDSGTGDDEKLVGTALG